MERLATTSTDAVRTEQDLQQRIDELSEAVAARDTFIAVAAHELRNPMMPIIGQIDLLLSALRVQKCSLDDVTQRLERIQHTVQQYVKRAVVLLDVSRINSGNFRLDPIPCDLAVLVRQVAQDFVDTAQHSGVSIEVVAPDTLPGYWDRLALEQILDNLLSNAIKYGNRSPVQLRLNSIGEEIHLQVRDHGRGIPKEHRARVFQRFERAVGRNEHRSGFGVGLWVVRQLVDAMRGSIHIDDAPGGGALFAIRLPKLPEQGMP